MLQPLTFAHEHASRGGEVSVLSVLWAVRALTDEGAKAPTIEGRHAGQFDWLRQRLSGAGFPASIREISTAVTDTGRVRLFACKLAAATFEVSGDDLIPEAESLIDPNRFLAEHADGADPCLCF
jgi:peroxiredoxin family protein